MEPDRPQKKLRLDIGPIELDHRETQAEDIDADDSSESDEEMESNDDNGLEQTGVESTPLSLSLVLFVASANVPGSVHLLQKCFSLCQNFAFEIQRLESPCSVCSQYLRCSVKRV